MGWSAKDSLFQTIAEHDQIWNATTGHAHTGAADEGAAVDHAHLLNKGTKTHATIDSELAAATAASHTHANKTTLDAIQQALTTALKANYDAAYAALHSHSNKTTLDAIQEALTTILKNAYDGAVLAAHGHTNKTLLDTYTQTETSLADAVANSKTIFTERFCYASEPYMRDVGQWARSLMGSASNMQVLADGVHVRSGNVFGDNISYLQSIYPVHAQLLPHFYARFKFPILTNNNSYVGLSTAGFDLTQIALITTTGPNILYYNPGTGWVASSVVADTLFHDLDIYLNAGRMATYYIDGALISPPGGVTAVPSMPMSPCMGSACISGGSIPEIDINYMRISQEKYI